MEMVGTKVKKLLSALLLTLSFSAFAQDFYWGRVPMDGSRASVEANVKKGSAKKVKAVVDKAQPYLTDLKRVVGYSDEFLTKRSPESPLSNWCADALLEYSGTICEKPCDVAICNFGGIRVDMPKGDVIVEDIRSMFPFKNDVAILQVRGSKLLALFNEMARTRWQVLGGVRIVASREGVESVLVGGEPLDENKLYSVITNTFLLNGGDGLHLASISESVDVRKDDMYEAYISHIEALTAAGRHIVGKVDGRITLTDRRPLGKLKRSEDGSIDGNYTSTAKPASCALTILHTNDTHSHIDPLRAGDDAGMCGVIERAVFVDSVRTADKAKNVLLVDAGDFEQGTPYFTLLGGKVEIESMNHMGYDAVTVGNHEWDNGVEDFARRMRMAKFKIVLCNYEFTHPGVNKVIQPYAIFKRGGKKIGVTGVLTDVTPVVDGDIAAQLRYINPVAPVNKLADFLKNKKGCDLVIVLSHLGFSDKSENIGDLQMAEKLVNVDYIIGGHSHTNLKSPVIVDGADGKPVVVVTDYCWGRYVGEIKIN